MKTRAPLLKKGKRRSHRVVVEITFDEPTPQVDASHSIFGMLKGWYKLPDSKDSGVTRFTVKQGERVIRAAIVKAGEHPR